MQCDVSSDPLKKSLQFFTKHILQLSLPDLVKHSDSEIKYLIIHAHKIITASYYNNLVKTIAIQ